MAKCFLTHFWFGISLIIQVLSSSSVVSQEVPFNPNIPAPQVVYKTPKTPLLQLAWTLPAYQQDDIQRYEVSVIRVSEDEYPTTLFTCDNDNFNEGLCTISGLSANSQYNVSVRACNANGCGLAAVAYITTSSRTSRLSIISTILVVVCLVIILISSVRGYDVIVELSKYCRKLTWRVVPEGEPNVEIQESASAPNLQDIELNQLSGHSNHSLEQSDIDIDRALAVPPSTLTVSPNPQTERGNLKADDQNGLAASALAQEVPPPPSQQSQSSRNSFRKVSH